MATYQFKNNFNGGINLDAALIRMPANMATFIKNLTDGVNINQNAPGGAGQDQAVKTPMEGNVALSLSGIPSGTNYTCGWYSSEQTNEGYFCVYNSNNNHTVWVISGDTGAVRKVHENTLLPFLLDPAHFIAEGRITMELISVIDPVTQLESNFKLLVFTTNNKNQCLIDVEASIATASYSTTYFTSSAAFYNRLELIHLGSVLPIKCVKLNDPTPYTPVPDDANKQNLLIDSGWQFRIRTWDVWGRPSEWGIISSIYTSLIGGGCISTSNGLPRCVNLCFDAGSPLIKFITVAYRRGVGNDPTGQVETGWYEHETFRKYDDSTGVAWYNRPINPVFTTSGSGMTFNAGTNIITYAFCADKGVNPTDPTETSRTEPGLARISGSVFSINKTIGLASNVYDFEPVSQSVIDQVQFSVKVPTGSQVPCDAAKTVTIVVYANIYNAFRDYSPLIRHVGGSPDVSFGDGNNGQPAGDTSCSTVNNYKVGQVFGDQTNPGFIFYLAGTPFKVVMEWGNYDATTGTWSPNPTFIKIAGPGIPMSRATITGVPAGKYIGRLASHHATINDANLQLTSTQVAGVVPHSAAFVSGARRTGYFSNPIKEIEIDCSAGVDVRLGALSDPMFLILDLNDGDLGGSIGSNSNGGDGYLYESAGGAPIEMAVCNIHGSTMGHLGDAFGSFFTDHNGYYFGVSNSSYFGIDIFMDLCDGAGIRGVFSITSGCGGTTGKMVHGNGSGARNPDYYGNCGSWFNQVYVAGVGGAVATFPAAAQRPVKQTITVCAQPTIGVPGIPVIMTKCQTSLTDSSGTATIVAHNRYNYIATLAAIGVPGLPYGASFIPDYGSAPGNQDLLIFSQKGGCEWNACGGCNTAMADVVVIYIPCGGGSSGCTTAQPPRTLCLTGLSAQPNGVGIFGVQSGAKYPVAFWLHDVISRHTSPQIQQGELGYVYTPNLNDGTPGGAPSPFSPPYPAMALCQLQVTIPTGLIVSTEFTHITFLVGPNALFYDFFSWAADWIQYVDNTGLTNTTNPTSIRVYFRSLNEYNQQYNQKTNVAWDFITKNPGQVNDIVQFIVNGDGTFLPSIKGAAVTYDQFGAFFTIDYQPELKGLQNGCLFKVIRPKQNTTETDLPYYEQCLTLDINSGSLPSGTWTIPYQDSYLLSRSIPVPILAGIISSGTTGSPVAIPLNSKIIGAATGQAGVAIVLATAPPGIPNTYQIIGDQGAGIAPGALPPFPLVYTSTNNDTNAINYAGTNNNTNGVVVASTKDYATTFPFFFESPSPSDLWGSHLSCQGRIGVPNPYEAQYRVGTEISISNPIVDKGIVNGIGVFLEKNRQVFDRNTWGDITVVLVETSVCLVICDRDHFITKFNSSQLIVQPDGTVSAQNQYGIFQAPERKAGTNYGCGVNQINTIRKYAGIVRWLDISGYLVIHNFSVADSNTDDAGYLGYMLNKIAIVNIANLTPNANGLTYFIGGIDPKTYEYYLTSFNIPVSGSPSYINTQSQPTPAANETLVFDLKTSLLKGFASFTPEYYGIMPEYYLQRQFLSFKFAIPYIHHNNFLNNVLPPAYCNFFGVQCEVRITHVVNNADKGPIPDKVKRFLYNEIYCRQSIPGGAGAMPSALFFADVIVSEKNQTSRLLVARWTLRDGYQCAAYICASNTAPDPNISIQTGANAILDGDDLQGRWLQVSLTNNSLWIGTYFEMSEVVNYFNLLEKSAD